MTVGDNRGDAAGFYQTVKLKHDKVEGGQRSAFHSVEALCYRKRMSFEIEQFYNTRVCLARLIDSRTSDNMVV